MHLPRWFRVEELVPPAVYEARGEAAIELLDARALLALDWFRGRYGAVIVNDWVWGGGYTQSGLRTDERIGARFSQHRYGRAFDMKFPDATIDEVFEDFMTLPPEVQRQSFVTCIEDIALTPTWIHIDVRNCPPLRIIR